MSAPANIGINATEIVIQNLGVTFTDLENAQGVPVQGTLNFGIVREIKLRITPKNGQKDNRGRTRVPGYEVTASLKMMQTGGNSRALLVAYGGVSGNLQIGSGPGSVTLTEVIPTFDQDLDFSGGQSEITVNFDRDMTPAEVASLFTTSPPLQ